MDNSIKFWDSKNGDLVKEISGIHAGQITSVCTSPDAFQVLTSSRDNTLKIIDLRTFNIVNTFASEDYKCFSNSNRACFSSDGNYVAAGSNNGDIFIWNSASGILETTLKKHLHPIYSVEWNPSGGGNVFAVDSGATLSIWN
jgi:autophagy-related protein 16